VKASTPQLRALLATGNYVWADIWTITLNGGTVIRWTSADRAVTAYGQTFALGPAIDRSAISEKVGFEVATMVVNLDAGDDDLINDTPIIQFIANRGLDGALVRLERAFKPTWADPTTGTVIRFSGRVTSIGNIVGTHAEITVSSHLILLNINVPTELYQVPCLHSVYDAGCGLDPEDFAATGIIASGGSALGFGSNLGGGAGIYSQGRIAFLTGANAGVSRSVKTFDGAGGVALIEPLPAVPAAGDTFRAYQGCDLTMATCHDRFNNLGHLKATPFVPIPQTTL